MFQLDYPHRGLLGLQSVKKPKETSSFAIKKVPFQEKGLNKLGTETHDCSLVLSEDKDSLGNKLIEFYESISS